MTAAAVLSLQTFWEVCELRSSIKLESCILISDKVIRKKNHIMPQQDCQ